MKSKLFFLSILCLSLVFLTVCEKSSPTTPDLPSTPAPVINSFTATQTVIAKGDSSMLDWKTSNATSVLIDQGIGAVSESGIEFVYPDSTTTYTLTAKNSVKSVTANVKVKVKEAELQVVGTIKKKMKSYGSPYFEGLVKNVGNNTAWNADITIYCYGDTAQTILIDTAWDYLANGHDIRQGEKVPFEAICFNLDSHSQIKSRRIELDWLEGDISGLSNSELQKLHNSQHRAQELEMKKVKARMKKRGDVF